MPGHEHEELTERTPQGPAAPGGGSPAPLLGIVSAVGNRSLARAVAGGLVPPAMVVPGGRLVVARAPTVTPAPAAVARDDRELTENDKTRLRTLVVGRLNAAVPQLQDPKKADLPRIARHLKPVEGVLNSFAAGGEAQATLASVADEVRAHSLAIASSAGTVKAAVGRARNRWQAAQRALGAARSQIQGELVRRQRQDAKAKAGEPPAEDDREQLIQDASHLKAVQAQAGNAVTDLAEAPRNEEGLGAMLELNIAVADEMDAMGTLAFAPAQTELDRAKQAFRDGVSALAPFAMPRTDFLREMRQGLQRAVNQIAALVGDAEGEVEADPDTEPAPAPPPDDPGPAPSPNPLPPPPPPPPGTTP